MNKEYWVFKFIITTSNWTHKLQVFVESRDMVFDVNVEVKDVVSFTKRTLNRNFLSWTLTFYSRWFLYLWILCLWLLWFCRYRTSIFNNSRRINVNQLLNLWIQIRRLNFHIIRWRFISFWIWNISLIDQSFKFILVFNKIFF